LRWRFKAKGMLRFEAELYVITTSKLVITLVFIVLGKCSGDIQTCAARLDTCYPEFSSGI
jgi:hypothetical protein